MAHGGPPLHERRSDILIVEDDARLAALLAEYLSGHGFAVEVESRGHRAVERIWADDPALVILDLMLPGIGGFDICRRVRERYGRGILMLTASKVEADQAVGLELGADDYVIKPIEPRILLARVRSLLRRLNGSMPSVTVPSVVAVGHLAINRAARDVTVSGQSVDLTGVEFDVLWLLARRAGEVVSRDDLYMQVRGIPYDGLDRGMDVHVSRLRQKLEARGFDSSSLKAVRGMGYLLVKR
jgi:two-component system response regulator RstA